MKKFSLAQLMLPLRKIRFPKIRMPRISLPSVSLIEIMINLAIIGIIAAIVIPHYQSYKKKQREMSPARETFNQCAAEVLSHRAVTANNVSFVDSFDEAIIVAKVATVEKRYNLLNGAISIAEEGHSQPTKTPSTMAPDDLDRKTYADLGACYQTYRKTLTPAPR